MTQRIEASTGETSAPGIGAAAAAFSAAVLLGAVLYLAALAAEGWISAGRSAALQAAVQKATGAGAMMKAPEYNMLPEEQRKRISQLAELEALIAQRKLRQVLALLGKRTFGEPELQKLMQKSIQSLISLEAAEQNGSGRKTAVPQEITALNNEFSIVRTTFAEILKFTEPQDAAAQDQRAVYASGFFSGLPVLRGLPGGLQDETQLALHLSSPIMAQLKQAMSRPDHELHRRLNALRERARSIVEKHNSLSAEAEETAQREADSAAQAARQARFLSVLQRQLLAEAAKWPVNERAAAVYSSCEKAAAYSGFRLPAPN